MENLVQCAVTLPLIEVVVYRLPGAELLGQVAPRTARAKHVEDAVHDVARILPRPAGLRRFAEHVRDLLPSIVAQSIPHHGVALRGRTKMNDHSMQPCTHNLQEQFSDRA